MRGSSKYINRSNAFEKERLYRVAGDELMVEENGRELYRHGLRDIEWIRLSYLPTRYQRNRYECRIKPAGRGPVALSNELYRGVLDFADQSPAYTEFVKALASACADAGGKTEFHAGVSGMRYVFNLFFMIFSVVVVIGVLALLLVQIHPGLVLVKLGVLIFLLPAGFKFMKRNRPAAFDPYDISSELLP